MVALLAEVRFPCNGRLVVELERQIFPVLSRPVLSQVYIRWPYEAHLPLFECILIQKFSQMLFIISRAHSDLREPSAGYRLFQAEPSRS
jgi:hypothetical protein